MGLCLSEWKHDLLPFENWDCENDCLCFRFFCIDTSLATSQSLVQCLLIHTKIRFRNRKIQEGKSALVHRRIDVDGYFNACTVHLLFFLFQPTSAHTHTHIIYIYIYIATVYLCVMFTPTCFDISMSLSGSFTFVPL